MGSRCYTEGLVHLLRTDLFHTLNATVKYHVEQFLFSPRDKLEVLTMFLSHYLIINCVILGLFSVGRGYDELGSVCLFLSLCMSDSSYRKRELLSREDLELRWRPLYELHDRILFSKTEHLGLNWFPKYASVLYCTAVIAFIGIVYFLKACLIIEI